MLQAQLLTLESYTFQGLWMSDLLFPGRATLVLGGGLVTVGCITHYSPLLWVEGKSVVTETPMCWCLEFLFMLV